MAARGKYLYSNLKFEVIAVNTLNFALEFYSLTGKIAAHFVDCYCRTQADHSLQFLPKNAAAFFAKPSLETLKRKNTKSGSKIPIKRPGWESNFKTNEPIQNK